MRRRPKLMMMACSTTVMKATGRYMTAWVGTLRCCACFISAVLSAHAQVFGQESDVELDVCEAVSEDAASTGTPLPHRGNTIPWWLRCDRGDRFGTSSVLVGEAARGDAG